MNSSDTRPMIDGRKRRKTIRGLTGPVSKEHGFAEADLINAVSSLLRHLTPTHVNTLSPRARFLLAKRLRYTLEVVEGDDYGNATFQRVEL